MTDNPLQTRPLPDPDVSVVLTDDLQYAIVVGFKVAPTPDGLGIIIAAPEGKRFSLADSRFVVSEQGRRLEVRAK